MRETDRRTIGRVGTVTWFTLLRTSPHDCSQRIALCMARSSEAGDEFVDRDSSQRLYLDAATRRQRSGHFCDRLDVRRFDDSNEVVRAEHRVLSGNLYAQAVDFRIDL